MTIDDARRFYAEEVRIIANVASPALVEAFARVPRENFLGPAPWYLASPEQGSFGLTGTAGTAYAATENVLDLYHNVLVAIDRERQLNNGQPSSLARWIDALGLKPGDRAFHLGCGAGYYTAIIAELVGPGGTVTGCEIDEGLAARARANLAAYPHVTVHSADGLALEPGEYDAMLINAGVTHPAPAWMTQLAEGGRLVLPLTTSIGKGFGSGVVARITREKTTFSAQAITVVAIYSSASGRDPDLDPLIRKAIANRSLFNLKSARLDAHEQTDACILHGRDVCLSSQSVLAE